MRNAAALPPPDVVRGEALEVRIFRDAWGKATLRGVDGPVMGDVIGVRDGETALATLNALTIEKRTLFIAALAFYVWLLVEPGLVRAGDAVTLLA